MAVDAFFIEEKLHELLNAKFAEEGFQDCFLVDFHLSATNKLEVFVDAYCVGTCETPSALSSSDSL